MAGLSNINHTDDFKFRAKDCEEGVYSLVNAIGLNVLQGPITQFSVWFCRLQ